VSQEKQDFVGETRVDEVNRILRKIRRKLTIVSSMIIIYFVNDLNFRLVIFQNKEKGIGFSNGVGIQGISVQLIYDAFFIALLVLTLRFVWFNLILLDGIRTSKTHNVLQEMAAKRENLKVRPVNFRELIAQYKKKKAEMKAQSNEATLFGVPWLYFLDLYRDKAEIKFKIYEILNVYIFPNLILIPLTVIAFLQIRPHVSLTWIWFAI